MIDEATKKDLINIMKISSGFDGRNRQILRKIVEIGETTSHFKSALGQKFIRRAKELLADPTQKRRCLICQKNVAENGMVCKGCISLYHSKSTASPKKEVSYSTPTRSKDPETNFICILTGWIRKKMIRQKLKSNPDYKVPQSEHKLLTLFTVFFLLCYLFSLYAGVVVLMVGLAIAAYTIIKKIKALKADGILLMILSVVFLPLGAILSIFGFISKMGYIYKKRKYIGFGFLIYGSVAFICATMYDIPSYRCDPGIVGYFNMIVNHDFGTRWNRSVTSATWEMIIFVLCGIILTYFVSGAVSLYLDEIEIFYKEQNISIRQLIFQSLQAPIEVLLIFLPLIVFVFCVGETLEGGWEIGGMHQDGLDIDNGTHHVSSYKRIRNGKVEIVRSSVRHNPDDIINNNFSYRGNQPYDGTNPIPNHHKRF